MWRQSNLEPIPQCPGALSVKHLSIPSCRGSSNSTQVASEADLEGNASMEWSSRYAQIPPDKSANVRHARLQDNKVHHAFVRCSSQPTTWLPPPPNPPLKFPEYYPKVRCNGCPKYALWSMPSGSAPPCFCPQKGCRLCQRTTIYGCVFFSGLFSLWFPLTCTKHGTSQTRHPYAKA